MSHKLMPKKLAQALMEASMQDVNIPEQDTMGQSQKPQNPQAQPVQKFGLGGVVGSIAGGVGGLALGGPAGAIIGGGLGGYFGDQFLGGGSMGGGGGGNGLATPSGLMPEVDAARKRANDTYLMQSQLAAALLNQSQGGGPNPAQNMLNQATGQNVQQQGALMASARGASANPALIARLAAQQGGQIQQQAAGQAATLQAQQQLEAQKQLQAQQAQIANQALQAQQINLGALTGYNQTVAGANAANKQADNQLLGGLLQAGGGLLASGLFKGPSGGGGTAAPVGPGEGGFGSAGGGAASGGTMVASHGAVVPGQPLVSGDSEKNDVVPALLSPGEAIIPRSIMQSPDMEKKALAFLRELKGGKKSGYGSVLEAKKMSRGGKC